MAIFTIHDLEEGEEIPVDIYSNFHSSVLGTFSAKVHKQYQKMLVLAQGVKVSKAFLA